MLLSICLEQPSNSLRILQVASFQFSCLGTIQLTAMYNSNGELWVRQGWFVRVAPTHQTYEGKFKGITQMMDFGDVTEVLPDILAETLGMLVEISDEF